MQESQVSGARAQKAPAVQKQECLGSNPTVSLSRVCPASNLVLVPHRAQRGPFRLPGFLRAPRPLIRDHVLLTVGTQQELLTSVVSHLASEALDHCR